MATLSQWSFCQHWGYLLPARASEQGNVIGSVSVYIYIYIYVTVPKKRAHFRYKMIF